MVEMLKPCQVICFLFFSEELSYVELSQQRSGAGGGGGGLLIVKSRNQWETLIVLELVNHCIINAIMTSVNSLSYSI